MRIAPAITLTGEQRKQLESWARGRSLPRRLGERAQMILLASEGRQNKEIARTLRRGRQGVARWRKRLSSAVWRASRRTLRDRDGSPNFRQRGWKRSSARPPRRPPLRRRTGAREAWRGRLG